MVIVSVVVRDFGSHMLQKISELENKSNMKLPVAKKILLAETGTVEQNLEYIDEFRNHSERSKTN